MGPLGPSGAQALLGERPTIFDGRQNRAVQRHLLGVPVGYAAIVGHGDGVARHRVAGHDYDLLVEEGSQPNAPFRVILVWKLSHFTRKREHAVAADRPLYVPHALRTPEQPIPRFVADGAFFWEPVSVHVDAGPTWTGRCKGGRILQAKVEPPHNAAPARWTI